jgi:putative redox protein
MAKETNVQANLVVGNQFTVETSAEHTIVLDAPENIDDLKAGPSPIEMLLSALAGCAGISMISILRKMRQEITAYKINVHGIQTSQYPQVFTEITVEHFFTGHALQADVIERAIMLTEKRYCSVSAMLAQTAQITHIFHTQENI